MTRGVGRAAALAAVPARKGRRAGQPVQPREISFTAARRAVIAAVRHGRLLSYTALTSALARCRTVTDRNRHRARTAKSPSAFPHAGPGSTATRVAEAVITIANTPRLTSQNAGITPAAPAGPRNRPSPGTTHRPSACPETTRYAA